MKICTALQFKKNNEGKLILQAKWATVQFSGTYALQLTEQESDWQDVDLANDVLPTQLDALDGEVTADPISSVASENKSKEEKDAVMKIKAEDSKETKKK